MLWVYDHYENVYSYSAWIDFRGSTLVVIICRLQIMTTKVDARTVMVKPSRCTKAPSCISEELLNFLQLVVLERQFSWNCFQNNTIFFHPHLHPLQVENCDSNSRLVVDEDDNGKFRLEQIKAEHVIQTISK